MKYWQEHILRCYLTKTRIIGLSLLFVTLIVWFVTSTSPDLVEYYYSRGLYPIMVSMLAFIGSILPIALTGLIFIFLVLCYLCLPVYAYLRYRRYGLKAYFYHLLLIFGTLSGYLLFLVVFTFCLNHHRQSEMELFLFPEKVGEASLEKILTYTAEEANVLSGSFPKNSEGCSEFNFDLAKLDVFIEQEQSRFLESNQLPAIKTATTRYFFFGNVWLGMGVAGLYQPFVGQPAIPPGLPNYSMPFVIGHERGHLNGFASEAGATLLSLQTMFHSQDVRLQYLALLSLWSKENFPKNINTHVARDIECFENDWKQVQRFKLRKLATKINDYYLKISGHKDGVKSYDRGFSLALGYYYKYIMAKEN
jgi:hypothetical protein